MKTPAQTIGVQKRLGEIAFRVRNMQPMVDFYKDVIQLPLIRQEPHMAFFKLAAGYKGHTCVLALFARGKESIAATGSLDHVALSIDLKDFEPERKRLEGLGLAVDTEQHNWMQWRSLYVTDPEGNRVEFVCFDPSLPHNYES
jgi:catechol 2,3-dioxygenase-like lactoylglutathione lyase family enzyme